MNCRDGFEGSPFLFYLSAFPRGYFYSWKALFLSSGIFTPQYFTLRFLQEVTMLGPDPAVLFWLPVGIIIIVLVAGFAVYHFSNSNADTSK